MGQRSRSLAEIFGFDGWFVQEEYFESNGGRLVEVPAGLAPLSP